MTVPITSCSLREMQKKYSRAKPKVSEKWEETLVLSDKNLRFYPRVNMV